MFLSIGMMRFQRLATFRYALGTTGTAAVHTVATFAYANGFTGIT